MKRKNRFLDIKKNIVFVILFIITNTANSQNIEGLLLPLMEDFTIEDSIVILSTTDTNTPLLLEIDSVLPNTQNSSIGPSDSSVIMFLSEIGIVTTNDNKLRLLNNARIKFEDLFLAIKNAKHHIHLEYFNFRNDSIGNALFDLLAVKAQQGVQVRAIFDGFGNWSNNLPLKKKKLEELRNRGIEIVPFDDIYFPYINHIFHRDHRKIVVIDGIIGYTGGINVADYYIQGLPKLGVWHDTHIRIEGSAVKSLQEIFLSIWNKTTKQNIVGAEYFPNSENPLFEGKHLAIVDRTPRKTPENIRRTYAKSIAAAKKKIQIVNPYFLPTNSIKEELRAAIRRGVKVEIMFSQKADIHFTPEGSLYAAKRLMLLGADIYIYKGGFHHSKTMMIDDSFCTIGSTNLDGRSLRYDYEVNAFIFDKEMTNELSKLFEADKEGCFMLTPEIWTKRSAWKRFIGWFANVLTPFL